MHLLGCMSALLPRVPGAGAGQQTEISSPGTGVMDSCELQCSCWDLNPGPRQEQ